MTNQIQASARLALEALAGQPNDLRRQPLIHSKPEAAAAAKAKTSTTNTVGLDAAAGKDRDRDRDRDEDASVAGEGVQWRQEEGMVCLVQRRGMRCEVCGVKHALTGGLHHDKPRLAAWLGIWRYDGSNILQ
jgi:hypothetical protein